jgi:hypothetical protein
VHCAADRKLDSEQPLITEQQAPPAKPTPPAAAEDPHAGFTVAVGNGLFWLLPYIMYWASSTTLHSGMFDNGRLDYDHARCAALPQTRCSILMHSISSSGDVRLPC